LRFIWLLDASGSMELDGKIQALNDAIAQTIPLLREDARANPDAELLVQSMTFATQPMWLDQRPVPIEQYQWSPIDAVHQGLTELGLAIRELLPVMDELESLGRGFPPAIVLVSDGQPSSVAGPKMETALAELEQRRWGRASLRAAVGIGRDADMGALATFMGNGDLQPVKADSPEELVSMIQWVSRMVSSVASNPDSKEKAAAATPPPPTPATAASRIWDDVTG
jgi:uncharacterized protein YegL